MQENVAVDSLGKNFLLNNGRDVSLTILKKMKGETQQTLLLKRPDQMQCETFISASIIYQREIP